MNSIDQTTLKLIRVIRAIQHLDQAGEFDAFVQSLHLDHPDQTLTRVMIKALIKAYEENRPCPRS